MKKLFIFTAPSGAGKTTIVRHLLKQFEELAFSVSATTRSKRYYEVEGKDYYFISPERFKALIAEDAFVEWEEVYTDQFYGTLKSEVERLWRLNKHIIFDIDVKGALNIKKCYPEQALGIFVKPPSLKELENRLQMRKTEDAASFKKRIDRSVEELEYENRFDLVLINDNLEETLKEAENIILKNFEHN